MGKILCGSPTKDGRCYYFKHSYRDILGNLKSFTSGKFATKKEAELARSKFIISVDSGSASTNITIGDAFADLMLYKSRHFKETSLVKNYSQYRYIECLSSIKVNDLDVSRYRSWLSYLDSFDISVVYKNKLIGLLKQIISHSSKYYGTNNRMLGFMERLRDLSIKKEMEFFTLDEFRQFVSVITNEEDNLFFSMLYYMGFRQGELQALSWDCIDFVNKRATVKKSLTTKLKGELYTLMPPKTSSSNRDIPIPDNILSRLLDQRSRYMGYNGFSDSWFVFGGDLPFRETTICSKKNKYCASAGVKQIRIHDFRHSCASLLIHQGASVVLISKYLGHSDIEMTLNTYSHLYKSDLDNISNLLNNL